MPASDLVCDACGLPPFEDGAVQQTGEALPRGWVRRTIGKRTFTLCDCCGDVRHFRGSVSAYLQEALGVNANAVVDFSATSEPGSGLHRHRIKPTDPPDDAAGGDGG